MIISLCSGYGGLDLAVSSVFNLPVAAHAEPVKVRLRKDGPLVENPVRRVLETRFPGVPNIGDITSADWTAWRDRCSVLCAGFPCQPVSAAGRQLAEDDDRWLWPSVHRAIVELDPAWVVLENVANIVSIRGGEVWRLILDHLRAAGYEVAWGIFGACLVGACHHRHRMFLVARRSADAPGKVGPDPAFRWPGKACGAHRAESLPTPIARDASARGEGSPNYWATKRAAGWTGGAPLGAELALLPTPVARDAGTSAPSEWERSSYALRTQVLDLLRTPSARDGDQRGQGSVEHMERRIADGVHAVNLGDQLRLLPTPRATDGTNGGPGQRGSAGDLAMPSAVQPEHFGRFADAVARHAAWMGQPPAPVETGPRGGVRMAAPFPEWMMGLPAGYVTGLLGRNDALRAIGNGVMPQQGAHAIRELLATLA